MVECSLRLRDSGLDEWIAQSKRPLLGICIGMQLLATEGFEHEGAKGLDWIPGRVVRVGLAGQKILAEWLALGAGYKFVIAKPDAKADERQAKLESA